MPRVFGAHRDEVVNIYNRLGGSKYNWNADESVEISHNLNDSYVSILEHSYSAAGVVERGVNIKRSRGEASFLSDQFIALNLESNADNTHSFKLSHNSSPTLEGGDDNPDVALKIEMIAFSAGEGDPSKGSATLRLDVCQHKNNYGAMEPLYWSIAAGVDIASLFKKGVSPSNYRKDFQSSFSNREIEVPGGLCNLSFELVRHKEQPWWQKIFKFANTGAGSVLLDAAGFPGITRGAVDIIDQAFDRLHNADKDILFKSAMAPYALSAFGVEDYTLGSSGVKIGVLNKGFTLLVPQRHVAIFEELAPTILPSQGRLLPRGVSELEALDPDYKNPFDSVPYVVLKVKTASTKFGATLS